MILKKKNQKRKKKKIAHLEKSTNPKTLTILGMHVFNMSKVTYFNVYRVINE